MPEAASSESRRPDPMEKGAGWLYALFFASGLAALVYQVMWARNFGLVFGSTTEAAAVVLATFFFGMGAGNLVGGRLARGRLGALLWYAVIEFAIALLAPAVILWLAFYQDIYPAIYQSGWGEGAAFTALRVGLAFVAMAPPCIAMGATLPLISRAIVTHTGHLSRRVAGIYALNTLGAVAGTLLSGFILPVQLGVRGAVLAAALLNALVGVGALLLWRKWRSTAAEQRAPADAGAPRADDGVSSPAPGPGMPVLSVLAALSGVGTLALEVLYTRLVFHVMDATVHAFAIVLATFLICLALGSALVSAIADRVRSPGGLLAVASLVGGATIVASPRICLWAWRTFPVQEASTETGQLVAVFVLAFLIIGPGVLAIGMILPLVWKLGARQIEETGRRIGILTGINTLAGVVGSIAGGFWLMPWLGVSPGIVAVGAVYVVFGLGALAFVERPLFRWAAVAATALAVTGIASTQPWQMVPLALRPGEVVLSHFDGDGGSVSVTRRPSRQGPIRLLKINNYYVIGGDGEVDLHRSQAGFALALHGAPRSIAFIGLATGITMSAITDAPTIERAVAMELVPGVYEAAHLFAHVNRGVLDDPRVSVRVADGRNHLYGSGDRYDVIAGDLFVPWHPGTGYLYTAEHFANVRERLEPGGVFVQWLQANQVSSEELRIIAGTLADAFDDATLWINTLSPRRPMLGLVARVGDPVAPPIPFDDVRRLCTTEELRNWAKRAPRNTDDFPIIEFSSASSHLVRASDDASGREIRQRLAQVCPSSGPLGRQPPTRR